MKKISIIAVLAFFAATSVMAASVINSRHDMVASGFASAPVGGSTEVCIFCHTPHGAQTSVTQAPLWNNRVSANITNIYTSSMLINGISTQNFTPTAANINATDARLCLACHDGGVGAPINQPNSGDMIISTTTLMDANALIGTNLSNDHPIGMNLGPNPETNPLGGASGLRTFTYMTGATGFNENPFFGATNMMWCSTCHDVHDGDPLMAPFLRISNSGSAMCKACHKK